MSAANKRRGSEWELSLLKHFRNEGYDCERLRLAGREDEGDLVLKVGGVPYVFEAKNEQGFHPSQWVKEAQAEAVNYANHRGIATPHFAAIAKKRNDYVGNGYVITPVHEFLRIITPG